MRCTSKILCFSYELLRLNLFYHANYRHIYLPIDYT